MIALSSSYGVIIIKRYDWSIWRALFILIAIQVGLFSDLKKIENEVISKDRFSLVPEHFSLNERKHLPCSN